MALINRRVPIAKLLYLVLRNPFMFPDAVALTCRRLGAVAFRITFILSGVDRESSFIHPTPIMESRIILKGNLSVSSVSTPSKRRHGGRDYVADRYGRQDASSIEDHKQATLPWQRTSCQPREIVK